MKGLVLPVLMASALVCGCSGTLSQMNMPSSEVKQVAQNGRALSVNELVTEYMQSKQVSGMVVAVIHDDGPAKFYCYGVTDEQHRYPVTPDTLFALGSLSKGITAEVTTLLVNEVG